MIMTIRKVIILGALMINNSGWGSNDKININENNNSAWDSNDNNNNNSSWGDNNSCNNDSRGRGRGRGGRGGRGGDRGRGGRGGRGNDRGRGGRGRGRNFNDANSNNNFNNNNDNVEIPDNAHEELFVKGISYDSTEDDLREVFSKYGDIAQVKILKDKETQKSKGIGFVKFNEKKSAVIALNDADNISCQGRNLMMKFSNDKEGEFKGKKGGKGGKGNFNKNNHGNNNNNDNNNSWGNITTRILGEIATIMEITTIIPGVIIIIPGEITIAIIIIIPGETMITVIIIIPGEIAITIIIVPGEIIIAMKIILHGEIVIKIITVHGIKFKRK